MSGPRLEPDCVEPSGHIAQNIAEIDLAAGQGESGEDAARKAEEAGVVAIDLRRAGPSAKHVGRTSVATALRHGPVKVTDCSLAI